MTVVKFPDAMPQDVRDMLRPYIERWLWVVPAWCEEIIVRLDNLIGDDLANCTARRDYRWTRIVVAADFLSNYTDSERQEIILHELLHIHHAALHEVFGDMLETFVTDEKQREMMTKQKCRAIEMMTVDLTTAIKRYSERPTL